ncbi:hypothetical protein DL96DRAFT_1592182 [Flagelloscypha sp. PMI_526]|nr:hypothetical protein DL96DRAFT_1592182 [Flagelloscypha sp. PMI_526]
MKPQIRVSLEPHLREKLDPLIGILPPELQDELRQILDNTTARRPTSIPYDLLLQISQWSRSPAGNDILKAHQPPLSPNDYVMVSLLAGTTSSPEGKFGTYVPPPDPEQVAKRESAERKAILTLVNAVLSVAGAGFASFWAADKTGWKREYQVLFALLVAIAVAFSEAVLYLIWTSQMEPPRRRSDIRRPPQVDKKKVDSDEPTELINAASGEHDTLRRRHPAPDAVDKPL